MGRTWRLEPCWREMMRFRVASSTVAICATTPSTCTCQLLCAFWVMTSARPEDAAYPTEQELQDATSRMSMAVAVQSLTMQQPMFGTSKYTALLRHAGPAQQGAHLRVLLLQAEVQR